MLWGLDNVVAVIRRYDHFFQELYSRGRPDPDVEFNEEWKYYVVDFQGWSRQSIPLCVAREYYFHFGSLVGHEEGRTIVSFRRWEPNFTTSAQPAESMETEGRTSMIRGSLEIRELHRSRHAPERNNSFDWDGRPSFQGNTLGTSLS